MSPRVQTCRCGTPAPPSVSVASEDARTWHAILECPACGFVTSALGPDAIHTLAGAAIQWNVLSSVRTLYTVRRPRKGGR